MKTKILTGIIYVLGAIVIGLAARVVFFENTILQITSCLNIQADSTTHLALAKLAEKPRINKSDGEYLPVTLV